MVAVKLIKGTLFSFQDIIHMYKMQQLRSPFERTKSHEELETPTYTTTIPPKFA